MKVLVIIPSLGKFAPAKVARDIFHYKNDKSITYDVLSLSGGEMSEWFSSAKNIFILNGNIKNKIKTANRIIKNNGYDVVHSHGALPDIVNALFFGGKSISTIHNYMFRDYKMERGLIRGLIMTVLHTFALLKIKHVIGCSESVFNNISIVNGFIRNGVECSEKPKQKIKRGNKTLLVLGRVIKRKNIAVILNACNGVDVNVIVVGDGDQLEEMKIEFSNSNNINFVGFKTNVDDYYNSCDFYASSSLAEGLPLSVMDALSHGKPYILSDIEPHREIDRMCKNSGFIVENSITSFNEAIIKMISLSDEELSIKSRNARNAFENTFNVQRMSNEYIELYKV